MNPFLASAKITVLNKKSISYYTIPVTENVSKINRKSESVVGIEVDDFCKFYQFSRRVGLLKLLKPAGCRMLLYVLAKLNRDQDVIKLQRSVVSKDLNMSDTTVGSGIGDLCENGFLCKKSRSEYWINPIAIFNGDRKAYFEKNAPNNIYYIEDRNPSIQKYANLENEIIVI